VLEIQTISSSFKTTSKRAHRPAMFAGRWHIMFPSMHYIFWANIIYGSTHYKNYSSLVSLRAVKPTGPYSWAQHNGQVNNQGHDPEILYIAYSGISYPRRTSFFKWAGPISSQSVQISLFVSIAFSFFFLLYIFVLVLNFIQILKFVQIWKFVQISKFVQIWNFVHIWTFV
jgi:hypothetical protein